MTPELKAPSNDSGSCSEESHETSRKIGTPALRTEGAGAHCREKGRNEAGGTIVRRRCEESGFPQKGKTSPIGLL